MFGLVCQAFEVLGRLDASRGGVGFLFFCMWSHGNPAVLTCLLFSDSVREMEQFSGFVVSF